MGKVIVTEDWERVQQRMAVATDAALANMAADIERLAKHRVPVLTGYLLSQGRFQKEGMSHYTIQFNTAYASYQEFGERRDGSHVVKKYSKAGSGKMFLTDAAKYVTRNYATYFKATAIGAGL